MDANYQKTNQKDNNLLSKGNWVVHCNYGIGQIKGVEKKQIGGIETLYFRVEGEYGIYWLPVSKKKKSNSIRAVATREQLQKAMQELQNNPLEMDDNHKVRHARIKGALRDGTILNLASLVRDMSFRNSQKYLSVNEKDLLEALKKKFVMEWATVMRIKPKKARNELDKILDNLSW